jgi:hypothetical protein
LTLTLTIEKKKEGRIFSGVPFRLESTKANGGNMETRIQVTYKHAILVETHGDESQVFILTEDNKGKETKDFYSEKLYRNIKVWERREIEAHLFHVAETYHDLVETWDIGAKLLSGEYTPGNETRVTFLYA